MSKDSVKALYGDSSMGVVSPHTFPGRQVGTGVNPGMRAASPWAVRISRPCPAGRQAGRQAGRGMLCAARIAESRR